MLPRLLVAILTFSTVLTGCGDDDRRSSSSEDRPTTSYFIPAASMEPTLRRETRVTAEKVQDYAPSRGDIVVFAVPDDWMDGSIRLLVKRVIGLPGETVACCDDDGLLTIDGTSFPEDYIAEQEDCNGPMVNACSADWRAVVPDGHLFVMGDNRAASVDSSDTLCKASARSSCDDRRAFVPLGSVEAVVLQDD